MGVKIAAAFLGLLVFVVLAAILIMAPTLYFWIFALLLLVWAGNSGGLWKLAFYLAWFGLPMLILANCTGNEGTGIQSCVVDNVITRSLAEFLYATVLLSAIPGMGIPFLLYGLGGWFLGQGFNRKAEETEAGNAT